MPSFLDRFRSLFRKEPPPGANIVQTQATPEPRSLTDPSVTIFRQVWDAYFELVASRRARYNEYNRMDSGWIATQLDAIVDACLVSDDGKVFGFNVKSTNAQYQAVIDQVLNDTNIVTEARETLRDVLKYGDDFIAPLITEEGDIVGIERPAVSTMIVNVDEFNRLRTDNDRGFAAAYQQVNDAGTPVAGWYPYEMFHLKFAPSRKNTYSRTAYLEPMRPDWHRLRLIEEALVLLRLLRATPRNAYYIDITGKHGEEAKKYIDDYIANIKKSKLAADTTTGSRQVEKVATGVDEDIFIPVQNVPDGKGGYMQTLGKVELLDPQIQAVRNLPDVEYIRGKLFSRIPAEMAGVTTDRQDLSQQDVAAGKFFQWCQRGILEQQLIRPLIGMALFFKFGGVAQDLQKAITVQWPRVMVKSSWRAADAMFRMSMAYNNQIEGRYRSPQQVAQEEFGVTEEEWNETLKQLKAHEKEFPNPPPGGGGSKANLVRQGNQSASKEDVLAWVNELLKGNGNGHS